MIDITHIGKEPSSPDKLSWSVTCRVDGHLKVLMVHKDKALLRDLDVHQIARSALDANGYKGRPFRML
jgi:hypothetical protein